MKGIVTFLTGAFTIAVLVLVMGSIYEPITALVTSSDAVQALGWDEYAVDIQDTVLRWVALLGITFFVVWAFLWAIRREKMTGVRRQR